MEETTSRHVSGSGATTVAEMPNSFSAATGFEPRAAILVFPRAVRNFSRLPASSTMVIRDRMPTPVRKITRSKSPAISLSINSRAKRFELNGTSRMAGTTNGSSP